MTAMFLALMLEQELEALLAGESAECPACGGALELHEDGRAECRQCGSVLEARPPPRALPGQLSFL